MRDQFDVDLEDGDLMGEVELSISLMIAATASPEHLSQDQIDVLLGITPAAPDDDGPPPTTSGAVDREQPSGLVL